MSASRLRKAINMVKDRTSIGLIKVSRTVAVGSSSSSSSAAAASQINLLILKATSHDDLPIDDGHVERIVLLSSSSSTNMVSCAFCISHRLTHTHDWIVALKCLHLVHRLLRHDHGHFFACEALSIVSRLSSKNPREDHGSTFVHALASYLDESLRSPDLHGNKSGVTKMTSLLERIRHLQRVLDRATAMTWTTTMLGRRSRLVHATLQEVVCESFEVYREVKEGLGILVDRFLDLESRERVETYRACVRTSRQAVELAGFYESCRAINGGRKGVGTFLPHMEGVHVEVLRRLHGFLTRTPHGRRRKKKSNKTTTTTTTTTVEADWEVVLMDTVSAIARDGSGDGFKERSVDRNNPFLEDAWEPPTFGGTSLEEMRVREEQRMWLHRQQMIIAKRKLI